MRVLVACEFSGVVREAFRARGHDAWSCDLLPSESDYHIQGDVMTQAGKPWDLVIAHPPCTYLCNSGVRWLHTQEGRWAKLEDAREFFRKMHGFYYTPRLCVENPIPHKHALLPKYDQIIQPWQFGHKQMKATCLWLRGLPPLTPTNVVGPPPKDKEERKAWAGVHRASPGPDRWKERSVTFQGIADAMAEQWGAHIRASTPAGRVDGTAERRGAQ